MKRPTSKKPNLTTDIKKVVDAMNAMKMPPLHKMSYEEVRASLNESVSSPNSASGFECDVQDLDFPVGPTGSVDVRIVRPKGSKGQLPVVMFFHGGGWVAGNKATHDRLIRQIAVESQVAVVFVDYANAPEVQYPDSLEQAYAALEYVYQYANKFSFDITKIALVGDSAGGNMAAALALMAKIRKGPKIKLQVLICPALDAKCNSCSYKDFKKGPVLTKKDMEYFWNLYAPDKKQRKEIFASPINATIEQLRNLPQALVITSENDVLRDEAEAYAKKMMVAGVDVVCVRYNGTVHDFVIMNNLAKTSVFKAAVKQITETLKEALKD